jgi:signal transduction histidine kinase
MQQNASRQGLGRAQAKQNTDTDKATDADSRPTLEFLMRSSSDGVLLAGAALKLTHINPAAAAMLAITPDEVLGRRPQDVFKRNQALVNLFGRDGEQRLDVRLPRQRLAVGIAETLRTGERVVLLHDVTEKRDLDTRRDMLMHSISHDLRNPISAVGGFAELVAKFGDLNEQQDRFLRRIRQTSDKLQDVIGSLVDLAWIEAGMPLAHVPIRLGEAIDKAIREVRDLAQKRSIGIATSLQKPLPVVMGDPQRLHLVIYHLLHNAIIYSRPEDNIVIHAWGDENEVYCSVADQGIGIADSELELIFDRMYRSRDEQVRNIPGGGLGLTIARTIIRRHGGDIWASSNLGVGSTFTFVLPVVQL